jgi:hypothetical protein
VTEHPTAKWTAQQFRMVVPGEQPYRWVIHNSDTIYTEGVDRTIGTLGLTVLKAPVRAASERSLRTADRQPFGGNASTG